MKGSSQLVVTICVSMAGFGVACSGEKDEPPTFRSRPAITARVGSEYTYDVVTDDSEFNGRAISAETLPSWLTIEDHGDGTALLSGVPTPFDTGENAVALVVRDGDGADHQSFSIQVSSTFFAVARDDAFDGKSLAEFWHLLDPAKDSRFSVKSGTLRLLVPAGVEHVLRPSGGTAAPRLVQPVPDNDFAIEAKFVSLPSSRFQLQGIVAQEAADRFVHFGVQHDGGGLRVVAASARDDETRVHINHASVYPEPTHLRVLRNGEFWTFQYSPDGAHWTVAATFSETLVVRDVGLFAGNGRGTRSPSYETLVDYFRNSGLSQLPALELPEKPAVRPASQVAEFD